MSSYNLIVSGQGIAAPVFNNESDKPYYGFLTPIILCSFITAHQFMKIVLDGNFY
jgi:hypothetical protein